MRTKELARVRHKMTISRFCVRTKRRSNATTSALCLATALLRPRFSSLFTTATATAVGERLARSEVLVVRGDGEVVVLKAEGVVNGGGEVVVKRAQAGQDLFEVGGHV